MGRKPGSPAGAFARWGVNPHLKHRDGWRTHGAEGARAWAARLCRCFCCCRWCCLRRCSCLCRCLRAEGPAYNSPGRSPGERSQRKLRGLKARQIEARTRNPHLERPGCSPRRMRLSITIQPYAHILETGVPGGRSFARWELPFQHRDSCRQDLPKHHRSLRAAYPQRAHRRFSVRGVNYRQHEEIVDESSNPGGRDGKPAE